MPRLDQLPDVVPAEDRATVDAPVGSRGVAAASVDDTTVVDAVEVAAPPVQSAMHAALAARADRLDAADADLSATPVVRQRLADIAERGDPPAHPGPHARP